MNMSSEPRFRRLLSTDAQFVLDAPHDQRVFTAVQIDANGDTDGLIHNMPFAEDMVVDESMSCGMSSLTVLTVSSTAVLATRLSILRAQTDPKAPAPSPQRCSTRPN